MEISCWTSFALLPRGRYWKDFLGSPIDAFMDSHAGERRSIYVLAFASGLLLKTDLDEVTELFRIKHEKLRLQPIAIPTTLYFAQRGSKPE